MAKPTFILVAPATLERAQLETKKLADQLGELCLGKLLLAVTVGTAQTSIPHGLPRIPTSCLALPRADARLWQPVLPDGTNVYLRASASVVVDVWVFG
jgi:hypothetical protein